MLNAFRSALRHYRELILAGTFAVMAAYPLYSHENLLRRINRSTPTCL